MDQLVYRFQHRWETNAQYRAAVSGVVGIATLLLICACVVVVSTVANGALASVGLDTGNSAAYGGSGGTGTGKLTQYDKFPTPTLAPMTPQAIPGASPIPNSQTPPPGPTPTPTPTAGPPPPQGGGPATCAGGNSSGSWALYPCPQVHGQSGSLTIVAKKYPGAGTNVVLSFGQCSAGVDCTLLFTPQQGYALGADGTEVISYTVPAAAIPNAAPITGMINISGGSTELIDAEPVQ